MRRGAPAAVPRFKDGKGAARVKGTFSTATATTSSAHPSPPRHCDDTFFTTRVRMPSPHPSPPRHSDDTFSTATMSSTCKNPSATALGATARAPPPPRTSTMPAKGGPKKILQGPRMAETPTTLLPYEEVRLRQCMQNCARLQQLGISSTSIYPNRSATSQEKNKRYQRARDQDSVSEYDPLQDDIAGDISDGTTEVIVLPYSQGFNCTGSKGKDRSKTNNASDGPQGVKFQTRKRVYAVQQPTRCTRSKKSTAQPDASMPASDNIVVLPSTTTFETFDNFADRTQPDDGCDANPQSDGHCHSHMVNEDGFNQHEENTMDEGDNQMTHEGPNMGRGLQRINRARCGKLPIIIPGGHIRPVTQIIAAKGHVPMLICWKDYKRRPAVIQNFLGCLRTKFDINIDDPTTKNGCIEMMKIAIRQQRHRLKEEYFDPFPLHQLKLVKSWKTPKKMEACQKNKENRAKVKFPATTGSCSYPIFVENLAGESEITEPEAFDLFKLCHFSKKKQGYTPNVQLAIVSQLSYGVLSIC
ncbi:hypothetical protein PVAP13_9KG025200 [Panicum virgatum]|uniref:Uncharacterized protein n=1 Tax=Panicum virgatum TaxID=38727 RepID=A0A8T0NBD8_PANVG|nr:hypothetical protein PVAP13_9KG025200 [Panicum virgatum]